jgi:hypothetical protein
MSDTNAQAVESGPLSIDQAVEQLTQTDAPAEAEAAPEPEPEIEASPEAEDPEAAETPSEDGEVEAEPTLEAVDPPHFWAAEDKEAFAQLSPELQVKILGYEKNRDVATAKAIQEAKEAEKRAEQEASRIAQLNERLDKLIPEAEAAFASKWPDQIDWVATLNQLTEGYGLEEGQRQYLLLKEQHEQDTRQLAAAKVAKQEAEQQSFATFVQSEYAKLATVEPDLTDPKLGAERRQKVVTFLIERGVPAEQVRHAGAVELSLAYDAMRFREARKSGKAALGPKPAHTPAARPVTPAASIPQTPQRAAAAVKNRFAQTRSVDDAVAFLMTK